MNIFYAILLGIVEGLTEFIPVSSTAYMLIVQRIFNIPSDNAMFAFLILVQLGPLLALLVYFWKDYWSLIKAFFARPFSIPENRMAWLYHHCHNPCFGSRCFAEGRRAGLVPKPLIGGSHPALLSRHPVVPWRMVGQKSAQSRLDDMARQLDHRLVPGIGRLPRLVTFRIGHPGWDAAQLRPAVCDPLCLPDGRSRHACGRRV